MHKMTRMDLDIERWTKKKMEDAGFFYIRKSTWRIFESQNWQRTTKYWHVRTGYNATLRLFAGFDTKTNRFFIYKPGDPLTKRSVCKIAPFYIYNYAHKLRLVFAPWTGQRFLAEFKPNVWKDSPTWKRFVTNASKQTIGWRNCGDVIIDNDDVCSFLPFYNGTEGCHEYAPRAAAVQRTAPIKHRSNITWRQMLKEFPLLHKISIMLNDPILQEIVTKRKWQGHCGWLYMSLQLIADHTVDHFRVSYPGITKENIMRAVKELPIRRGWYRRNTSTVERQRYEELEKKMLINHPEMDEDTK